jgi:hypothetical protein
MAKFTLQDIEKIIAVTHSGMTVEDFQAIVKEWLAKAEHPRFKRPYTECIYQPMLREIILEEALTATRNAAAIEMSAEGPGTFRVEPKSNL